MSGSQVDSGYNSATEARARRVLKVATILLSEWSLPGDSSSDYQNWHRRNGWGSDGVALNPWILSNKRLVHELLISRAWALEVDELSAPHRLAFSHFHLVTVDGDPCDHIDGFVLTNVGEANPSYTFPVTIPIDVVALLVQSLGALTDRSRLLTELVSLYSDAVRLCGESVRVKSELICSLRYLQSLLSVCVSKMGIYKSGSRSQSSDDTNDERSNFHDKQSFHIERSESVYVEHDVSGEES